jgi:hypothetical protein
VCRVGSEQDWQRGDQRLICGGSEVPLLIDFLNLNYKRIASTRPDTMTFYDWVAYRFTDPSIVFFDEELNTAKADKK